MKNKRNFDLFIKWSSKLGPNVLDWIRSIYFSLIGSSMLTLILKYSVLNIESRLIFILGCSFFLLGLLMSVKVADRFKKHEKNYDAQDKEKRNMVRANDYYFNEEIDLINFYKNEKRTCRFRLEHFLLYALWIPAFFCVGYAGFYMENKSAKSSSDTKEEIHNIKTKVWQLDSYQKILIDITQKNKQLQDSLKVINISNGNREKQIDSLKKVIKTVTAKPKPIPIQKEIK